MFDNLMMFTLFSREFELNSQKKRDRSFERLRDEKIECLFSKTKEEMRDGCSLEIDFLNKINLLFIFVVE